MAKLILYVEDNQANITLVRRIVEVAGHGFVTALNAQEGWDMAHTHRPDLILMDVQLPGESGLDLTRRLKGNPATSDIPIVALTAFGGAEAELAAREAGCAAFLQKPADIRQIRDLFASLLGPSEKDTPAGEGSSGRATYL